MLGVLQMCMVEEGIHKNRQWYIYELKSLGVTIIPSISKLIDVLELSKLAEKVKSELFQKYKTAYSN
jgi:hypothetical protein